MAKGISDAAARKKARLFVRRNYEVPTGIGCSKTEKRGNTWIFTFEDRSLVFRQKFEVHVNAETGEIVSCKKLSL